MDREEINATDGKLIRKKSSFLRDSSYKIFHITKQSKDDNGINHNNTNEIIGKPRGKSLKITNRNGIKELLFLHKSSCELSSIDPKPSSLPSHSTNELCQSITTTPKLEDSQLEPSVTVGLDEIISYKNLHEFKQTNRKKMFISNHRELPASFYRRRKRFMVACGTVTIASCVIITIMVYVIIMTLRHITKMKQILLYNASG